MKAIASPPALPPFPPACTPPPRSDDRVQVVRDLPQLIEKILTLQPHDQVEMVLSIESLRGAGGETFDTLEERGFLMDIRVGPESNLCVMRTF